MPSYVGKSESAVQMALSEASSTHSTIPKEVSGIQQNTENFGIQTGLKGRDEITNSHGQPSSERHNSMTKSEDIPIAGIPTTAIQTQVPTAVTAAADESVAAALKDIKMAIQATRVLQHQSTRIPHPGVSPTSTMGHSISNRRHPTVGNVVMNGSAAPMNKMGNVGDVNKGTQSNTIISHSTQANKIGSQGLTTTPPSEQSALDPWVPRNNTLPTLPPAASQVGNNDIPATAPASRTVVAGAMDRSVQSSSVVAQSAIVTNTSQAVQTMAPNSLQKLKSTVPVANSNVMPSNIANQQALVSSSQKESGKHHNSLMSENVGSEKGAGRRDVVHSQDVNIDDDVDDLEEDEEEEEDDEDELEDEESESELGEERVPTPKNMKEAADDDLDTDQETDRLLGQQYNDDNGYYDSKVGLH